MAAKEKARAVTQAKMLRIIQLFQLLSIGKHTVVTLAYRMDLPKRTIYRMLDLIDHMDIGLEQDFYQRYFIVDDCCPLCGIKNKKHETVEH